MVSRRPEAGSALGRGQRWERLHSHCTSLLEQGVGSVTSSPGTRLGVSTYPPTLPPTLTQSPLLLSDRTLVCRCSTTCRQTLSFLLAGWRCWRRSSGQVTLRHPHPQLRQNSLMILLGGFLENLNRVLEIIFDKHFVPELLRSVNQLCFTDVRCITCDGCDHFQHNQSFKFDVDARI